MWRGCEGEMKDFASFLMVGALCMAACASTEGPAANAGGVQGAAGTAAPAASAAGGSAQQQPAMTAATAGTKASTATAGTAAPSATATAGTPATATATAGSGGAATTPPSAAAAGSSGTATSAAPMGSFRAAYEMALRDMCMGCHTPDALIGSPNLATLDKAYDSLVDKDATTMAPGQCMGMGKLVTPGNCETSLLYNKIAEDTPKCGRHMPLGSDTMPTRLPPAALEAVCAWIKAGAKKD